MSIVFISGSRSLNALSATVKRRLDNLIAGKHHIIVGDAFGADMYVQEYLNDKLYTNVTVYHSGDVCRNNLGKWRTHSIEINTKMSARDFYTVKDKEMSKLADSAIVLWNGKSKGSMNNIIEMVKQYKPVEVYMDNPRLTKTVRNIAQAKALFAYCKELSF